MMETELMNWLSNLILLVMLPTLFALHGRLSKIEGQIHFIIKENQK